MPVLDNSGEPRLLYRVSRSPARLVAPAHPKGVVASLPTVTASKTCALSDVAPLCAPRDGHRESRAARRPLTRRRGGGARPGLVKDCLRASPDVATADPATIKRVAARLLQRGNVIVGIINGLLILSVGAETK